MDALWAELALVPGAEAEKHRAEIEAELLTPTYELAHSWMLQSQQHWLRPTRYETMLALDPSPSTTTLQFLRSGLQGDVVGYREVVSGASLHELDGSALSLHRPVSQKNFVRGSTSSIPFRPGGLDDAVITNEKTSDALPTQLRTVPPGFSRGLPLSHAPLDQTAPKWGEALTQSSPTNLDHTVITVEKEGLYKMPDSAPQAKNDDAVVDELLPDESLPRIFQSVAKAPSQEHREWAHVIHTSKQMNNFHELVPVMAHEYPFELDTFQKQAVYHLEQNDSVFVAAHTSAGKTVVAEYAIALATKHMTRCIYTSPIKALSNQKFREFKHTFGADNVGILTGDVQINPEATCLIMTTEILRSMLYRGADLIRDVEFVIFDEVHYVNDQERGVVWEEVIILLPAHINIVLLSATVPNTLGTYFLLTQNSPTGSGVPRKKTCMSFRRPNGPCPSSTFCTRARSYTRWWTHKGASLPRLCMMRLMRCAPNKNGMAQHLPCVAAAAAAVDHQGGVGRLHADAVAMVPWHGVLARPPTSHYGFTSWDCCASARCSLSLCLCLASGGARSMRMRCPIRTYALPARRARYTS